MDCWPLTFIRVKQNAKISAIEVRPSPQFRSLPAATNPSLLTLTLPRMALLKGGSYISNQWASIGMTLSMIGGLASENRPRLFNTSSVGNDPILEHPSSGVARLALERISYCEFKDDAMCDTIVIMTDDLISGDEL